MATIKDAYTAIRALRDYCDEQVDCYACKLYGFCFKYLRGVDSRQVHVPLDWDDPEKYVASSAENKDK